MSQFIGLSIFLAVASSMVLHAGIDLPPFLEWVGNLPGDLIIRKNGVTVYAPLASSVLISAAVSFVLSLLSPRNR